MQSVRADGAPRPIGPYSHAIKTSSLLFCSGQVAIDPDSGKLVEGDAARQTEQVLKNLGAILNAAGTDFGNVAKTTLFLTDMNDFAAVNAVYVKYFSESKPARSTVAVAALPLGAKVEIEVIAALPA